MSFDTYIRFILVLVFVLGLVLLLGWVLRRSGIGGGAILGKGRRLAVIESAFLGPKHRLVLVRRDAVEHLVLIGPMGNTVVESGIVGGIAKPEAGGGFHALMQHEIEEPNRSNPA